MTKNWGRAGLIAAALAVLWSTNTSAAEKSGAWTMTYEVYAGGINAVRARLDINYKPQDRYRIALEARTKGFLGKLAPWSGTFETEGWRMSNGRDMPEIHRSTALWRGDGEIKEYKYGKDGSFKGLTSTENGKDASPKDLEKDLTDGTTDVLSATLEVMEAIAKTGICEGTSEVFDGARRFKLVFSHEADEVMDATRYNVYSGPAARCNAEVVPMTGKWHAKPRGWMSIQEQGRQKGSLPTVWMAKMSETGPAIPVKVRVKTDYGTLFMHLIRFNDGSGEVAATNTGDETEEN